MRYILAILLLATLSACEKENRWDCFTSYGDEHTELRPLEPFTSLVADADVDIVYKYSEEYAAEVTFGDGVIKHIETRTNAGELLITNDARCNWVRDLSKKPRVVIYAPTFEYLENRGVGDIAFEDTLITSSFEYNQSDANGTVNLLLKADMARILLNSGVTQMRVRGIAGEVRLYSSSGSKLEANGLKSPVTLVNNSSIQPIRVYSGAYLFASISNRGDILYAGSPSQIDKDITGTGKLLPI